MQILLVASHWIAFRECSTKPIGLPYWTDCQKCPESGCSFCGPLIGWALWDKSGSGVRLMVDRDRRRRRLIYAVIKGIGMFIEYELQLFWSETHEHFAGRGVWRSQHETNDQWPWMFSLDNLVDSFCCTRRTSWSVNKKIEKLIKCHLRVWSCSSTESIPFTVLSKNQQTLWGGGIVLVTH